MNDNLKNRLLGRGPLDRGCEAGMAVVDQYVEAVLRGDDAARLFPAIVAHMDGCAACREDIEGLIEALRNIRPPDDRV
jgi:hypothetical protein